MRLLIVLMALNYLTPAELKSPIPEQDVKWIVPLPSTPSPNQRCFPWPSNSSTITNGHENEETSAVGYFCEPSPCKNGGICLANSDNFMCQCQEQYNGKLLEQYCEKGNQDPCDSKPCKNGGECFSSGQEINCVCNSQYVGKYCEKLNDNCSDKIYLDLKNKTREKQGAAAGIYRKSSDVNDGRPIWDLASDLDRAIWYKVLRPGFKIWMVGKKKDVGTGRGYVFSSKNLPCPEMIGYDWNYLDDKKWVKAGQDALVYKQEDTTPLVVKPEPLVVKHGHLVKTWAFWGPNFNISFDIKVLKKPDTYHSVMHFTTGSNDVNQGGKQGSRIPAIWLNSYDLQGDKTYFYVAMEHYTRGDGGKLHEMKQFIGMNLNEWYSVEMSQRDGQFTLKINGATVTFPNTAFSKQPVFQDVKWYQSDPWHPAATYDPEGDSDANMIELRNFQLESGISRYWKAVSWN